MRSVRSLRRLGALGDEPKLFGVLHIYQRNHRSAGLHRIVHHHELKAYPTWKRVEDTSAAPFANAKDKAANAGCTAGK